MNFIEELDKLVSARFPSAFTRLDAPSNPEGEWWLDIRDRGRTINVQWSPGRGFGVTASAFPAGYGDGPEETFESFGEAAGRVLGLMESGETTLPPPNVALRELRSLLKVTQTELAERMGVGQAAVSKLERRPDMSVSTLQRFVAALGGELEIRVCVADEIVRVTGVGVSDEPARACCAHVRPRLIGERSRPEPPLEAELSERLASFLGELEHELRWRLPVDYPLSAPAVVFSDTQVASLSEERLQISPSAIAKLAAHLPAQGRPGEAEWLACRTLVLHELGHHYGSRFLAAFKPLLSSRHPELIADAFLGWIDSACGESSKETICLLHSLGCSERACDHPPPLERVAAYLEGTRLHREVDEQKQFPRLNLVVLRATDLERTHRFYEGLGLDMRRERHGRGPVHYSWAIDGGVFELYPRRRGALPAGGLRLGFIVSDVASALGNLQARGFDLTPRHVKRSDSPSVWVINDPDGNTVELQERVAGGSAPRRVLIKERLSHQRFLCTQ